MTAEPPSQPKKRRWPRIRYSLLTLLLFVLLAGSGMGLWFRWEPWVVLKSFNSSWVRAARWSPEGKVGTAGLNDGRIIFFNRDTERMTSIQAHEEPINSLCYSPDGTLLLSTSDDGSVRVWRVPDGVCLHVLNANIEGEQVISAVFSPDAQFIATTAECHVYSSSNHDTRGRMRIWRVSDSSVIAEIKGEDFLFPSAICFSPDAKYIAFMADGKQLYLYNFKERRVERQWYADGLTEWERTHVPEWRLTRPYVFFVGFTPDGAGVVTLDNSFKQRLWTLTGACLSANESIKGFHVLQVRVYMPDNCLPCTGYRNIFVLNSALGMQAMATANGIYAVGAPFRDDNFVDNCNIYARRRPEQWWGVAWLPEFWLALVFGCAFLWSVRRDRREL